MRKYQARQELLHELAKFDAAHDVGETEQSWTQNDAAQLDIVVSLDGTPPRWRH